MTGGKKRIIDATILHLRAIKFITNAVVIGRGGEALFQISKREITGDARQGDRVAVSLGQLVAAAKIILARLVFRNIKPGITKPVGMLLNGSGNLFGVAAFGPKREEREFFFSLNDCKFGSFLNNCARPRLKEALEVRLR